MGIGVVVIEHMYGITSLSLPPESFHQAIARYVIRSFTARNPTDSVLQELAEICVTRTPHRTLDIAREIRETATSLLAQNYCRLSGTGDGRIREFRGISDKAWNHREKRIRN